MSQDNAIRSIVIVGGGTAGWMAAAALSRMLGKAGPSITLIESEQIGTVGVGEATLPNIATFNQMLGIKEADFMARTHGTFKLGIEFVDWSAIGERYIHPFGSHGVDMDGISFHQYWAALRAHGDETSIEDYSLSAVMAYAEKFTHPNQDPRSVLSQISYAYQFDATRYAAFLRDYSEQRGVTRIEGKVTQVGKHSESGFISHVTLERGETIEGDLFIDCSGFRALLISGALGIGYEDWTPYLPCNSAQAVACELNGPIIPYTRATAREAGWQWRIPTQHRTGNGYVYSDAYISDDEAAATLLANLDGAPLSDPKQLRFTTGRRKDFWVKNCVSLGLSGGFLEPLESTSIYLIQKGISNLISLLGDRSMPKIERDEYNALMHKEFEQVRDFLILHYVATTRDDTPFWDYCRTMDMPDSLRRKIDLFKTRGRFFRYDGDLFTVTSWVAVLLGQNVIPKHYDPIIDALPPERVKDSLGSMREAMHGAARQMPSHEAYLAKYCPSPNLNMKLKATP